MKKFKKILMLLFFLNIIFYCTSFFHINLTENNNVYAIGNSGVYLNINYGNKDYEYEIDLLSGASEYKEKIVTENDTKDIIYSLKKIGFSNEEIANYLLPETKNIFEYFDKRLSKKVVNDEIIVIKNKCEIKIEKGLEGIFLDKVDFYEKIVDNLSKNKKNIRVNLITRNYKTEEINKRDYLKKSEFSTNFLSSSNERKNNIKVALEKFDGIILNEGEILSFNKTTGIRNKDSGYLPAKIISGGTFIEGYGGGVCQVSTTLYNACLLAGLDILEVHSHSLPVSYVEPSFDAMVNQGSSDLVIKNNTGGTVIITTSSLGDNCKVAIFGKENNLKIERVSKKTKIIPASKEEIIETDYKKYGLENLEVGEEKKISYAKDGFFSDGYLNYYDKNGTLIKTEKIRESKYSATKGITVKKEN